MDNKAQVSFEYLIIIAVLMTLAAVTTIVALGFYPLKDSLRSTGLELKDKALSMLGG